MAGIPLFRRIETAPSLWTDQCQLVNDVELRLPYAV